jgi:hypothetical protein
MGRVSRSEDYGGALPAIGGEASTCASVAREFQGIQAAGAWVSSAVWHCKAVKYSKALAPAKSAV